MSYNRCHQISKKAPFQAQLRSLTKSDFVTSVVCKQFMDLSFAEPVHVTFGLIYNSSHSVSLNVRFGIHKKQLDIISLILWEQNTTSNRKKYILVQNSKR